MLSKNTYAVIVILISTVLWVPMEFIALLMFPSIQTLQRIISLRCVEEFAAQLHIQIEAGYELLRQQYEAKRRNRLEA